MIHYGYDTTALANGTAKTILDQAGKSWFFVTADYAFGTQLQQAATNVVETGGGKVIGSVRAPLSTSDFSSYLLQAQGSGAQVVGLAKRIPTRLVTREDAVLVGMAAIAATPDRYGIDYESRAA